MTVAGEERILPAPQKHTHYRDCIRRRQEFFVNPRIFGENTGLKTAKTPRAPRSIGLGKPTDCHSWALGLRYTFAMKLIVGLGNPGRDYVGTRHNAGFMVLDRLATRHGLSEAKSKFHGGVLDGRIGGDKCVLLQPTTYMNRSGLSVGEASAFYKVEPEDILIVVDDVALPIGKIRMRGSGGAGGHNGLSDIQRVLGTHAYPRLRIGIDAPGRIPQVDYVLGKFTKSQQSELGPALDRAADAIECWVEHGLETTMTRYNGE